MSDLPEKQTLRTRFLVRWRELALRHGHLRRHAGRAAVAALLLGGFVAVLLWRLAAQEADRKDAMLDQARADAARRETGYRSTIEDARGQAARDRDEIAGLRRQLQQVREERAELAGRMEALSGPGAPGGAPGAGPVSGGRRLGAAQYARLAGSGQGDGQLLTIAVSAGAEAHAYADQLAAALSAAGYEVTVADYDFKPPERGLLVAQVQAMQEQTARLEAALRDAGIAFRPAAPSWSNGMGADMRLEVRVGAAP